MTSVLIIGVNGQFQLDGSIGGVQQVFTSLVESYSQTSESDISVYAIRGAERDTQWINPNWSNVWAYPSEHRYRDKILDSAIKLNKIFPKSVKNMTRKVYRGIFHPSELRKNEKEINNHSEINQSIESILPEFQKKKHFIEKAIVDNDIMVMHYPSQFFVKTRVPSVYNPHDLQHIYFPKFFSEEVLAKRNYLYPIWCEQADAIGMATNWGGISLVEHYNIDPEKIFVIPWGIPTDRKISTPESESSQSVPFNEYMFYPAKTWKHKNHVKLIEAIYLLRENNNLIVNLVCSGGIDENFSEIKKTIKEYKVGNQIKFLGFVSEGELLELYRHAKFVIFPSLFEAGAGLPIMEAWLAKKAVVCSNIPQAIEQTKNAALSFDPLNPIDISDKIEKMWTNDTLRKNYQELGNKKVNDFQWNDVRNKYFALYRTLLKQATEEDNAILKRCKLKI